MELQGSSNKMEKCLFRKEIVQVPLTLIQDVSTQFSVI